MKEGIVIVKRKGEIIATVNLFSRSVDCRDEYTMMRLSGLMEDLIQ